MDPPSGSWRWMSNLWISRTDILTRWSPVACSALFRILSLGFKRCGGCFVRVVRFFSWSIEFQVHGDADDILDVSADLLLQLGQSLMLLEDGCVLNGQDGVLSLFVDSRSYLYLHSKRVHGSLTVHQEVIMGRDLR